MKEHIESAIITFVATFLIHFGLRFKDLSGNILDSGNGFNGWIDPSPFYEK